MYNSLSSFNNPQGSICLLVVAQLLAGYPPTGLHLRIALHTQLLTDCPSYWHSLTKADRPVFSQSVVAALLCSLKPMFRFCTLSLHIVIYSPSLPQHPVCLMQILAVRLAMSASGKREEEERGRDRSGLEGVLCSATSPFLH